MDINPYIGGITGGLVSGVTGSLFVLELIKPQLQQLENRIEKLEKQNKKLKKENEKLKKLVNDMIGYAPDGEKYNETKQHFEELQKVEE